MDRYDFNTNGCVNCTFEGCQLEVEDGGYLQAGYTPQDEWGECPEEANAEISNT